jgi:multidrug transporter EmrE-like cation transporter
VSAALPELGTDLLIVAAIFWLGWTLLRLANPSVPPLLALSLAYPAGAALLSGVIYAASLLKLPINPLAVGASYFVLQAFPLALNRRRTKARLQDGRSRLPSQFSPRIAAVLLSLTCLSLAVAYISIERSYSTWDAIAIWSIKGYGIAKEGTIFAAARWGGQGLAYPLNLPIQISLFRLFSGDWLPGSKLIFPIYYLALTLGAFSLLQQRLGWKRAGLGALILAATPIILQHGTLGYANLPFTAYLVPGFCSWPEKGKEAMSAALQWPEFSWPAPPGPGRKGGIWYQ